MIDEATANERLAWVRETLALDGYGLEIDALDESGIQLRIIATAAACDDCLVPKHAMAAMLGDALQLDEGDATALTLRYPGD